MRSSTVLIKPVSPVLDKHSGILLLRFGSTAVSFPLLNTLPGLHPMLHSAAKVSMGRCASGTFHDRSVGCCSYDLHRIVLSSNRERVPSAGMSTDLRSPSSDGCKDSQSRLSSILPLIDVLNLIDIGVFHEGRLCGQHYYLKTINPALELSM